jgi:hypothetical protein
VLPTVEYVSLVVFFTVGATLFLVCANFIDQVPERRILLICCVSVVVQCSKLCSENTPL